MWDPYTVTNKHKLEMVQRRSARFVLNRYHNRSSVGDMLETLGWQSLEERRKLAKLRMTYKIKHQLVGIPCDAYYTTVTRTTRSSHAGSFLRPIATTDYYRYSFFPHSTVLWGSLSDAIIASPSLDSFTTAVKCSLCSKSLQHVVVSKVVATLCSSYF